MELKKTRINFDSIASNLFTHGVGGVRERWRSAGWLEERLPGRITPRPLLTLDRSSG